MNRYSTERRELLRAISAFGAAATIALVIRVPFVHAADAPAYDPSARFELNVREVEFRVNSAGRQLMARIYEPVGTGPFPVMLDLHGGGWSRRDRLAEEPMDRAIAESGVLVVAIDMTRSGEAPYPAEVQDANYGVRWLKANAASWNGDASKVGVFASSSGGHTAQLLGLRPHDPRYNAIALPEAPDVDATVDFVAARSPISDTFARYENAVARNNDRMVLNNTTYFDPWETIHESNPQEILDRGEDVSLVPMLIMQGDLDDNVLPEVQVKFAQTYNAAGGDCQLEMFKDSVHRWTEEESSETDRARETVRQFIARQLGS
ncbi:MAG: alpha/beta hydrolase [Gammaproteobacteria bacterium]|nr:alpha/beta hydrolase [Gammaproteobacteria bacterium]